MNLQTVVEETHSDLSDDGSSSSMKAEDLETGGEGIPAVGQNNNEPAVQVM